MNKFISFVGSVENLGLGVVQEAPFGIGKALTYLASIYEASDQGDFWDSKSKADAVSMLTALGGVLETTGAQGFVVSKRQEQFLSSAIDVTKPNFNFSLVVVGTVSLDLDQQKKIAQLAKAYTETTVAVGKLFAVLEVFNPGFEDQLRTVQSAQDGMVPLVIPKERACVVVNLWNDVKRVIGEGAKIEKDGAASVFAGINDLQADFLQSLLYKKCDDLLPDALVHIMGALEEQHAARKTH